jgi:hypothetical protein
LNSSITPDASVSNLSTGKERVERSSNTVYSSTPRQSISTVPATRISSQPSDAPPLSIDRSQHLSGDARSSLIPVATETLRQPKTTKVDEEEQFLQEFSYRGSFIRSS